MLAAQIRSIVLYAHTQAHREQFECSTWVKSWLKDKANVCKCIMSSTSTSSSFDAPHNVVLHLHLVFLLLIVPRLCQFPLPFPLSLPWLLLLLVNWIKVQMLAINITKKLMPHVCAACGACVRLCPCLHVWLCGSWGNILPTAACGTLRHGSGRPFELCIITTGMQF